MEWCLQCEKCAFLFLLLSAWLEEDYIAEHMFPGRENMFVMGSDSSLISGNQRPGEKCYYNLCTASLPEVFCSLCDSTGPKPFDCVGTAEEAKTAIALIYWRYTRNRLSGRISTAIPTLLADLARQFCNLPISDDSHWLSLATEDEVLKLYDCT
jgi:hypothetical protein